MCFRKVSTKRHSMRPCVALILKLRKQPRDFIPNVFTLESYRWTYRQNIQPVDTRYLEIQPDTRCYPPILKRTRGRPKEKRMRKGDVQHRRGQLGRRNAVVGGLADVLDNAPHRCTQRGNVGHNRSTCDEIAQIPIFD